MDFSALLSVAQKNESHSKKPIACYQTKFSAPKKETKQSKTLSENIKKFLAKKQAEEEQKRLEEQRKKENLLSLRDQKTQNRINKHLKVCKAANKSVLADAIDNENTAITVAGPSQPDEDDYGFTSREAADMYNKMLNKYNNLPPEKPLFSDSGKRTVKDISSTKDRVIQALKQQQLEAAMGHRRRKRSSKDVSDGVKSEKHESENDKDKEKDKEKFEKDSKPKIKKKPAPPPMDFVALLKLAEKKQHEPIVIEVKPKQEEERPMTKKQQREYQKEKEWREKREQRQRDGSDSKPSNGEIKSEKIQKLPSIPKIPKINSEKSSAEKSSLPKKYDEKISKKPVDKSVRNGVNSSVSSSSGSSFREKEREKEKERERERDREKERERQKEREREREREKERERDKNLLSEERRKIEAERKELAEMKRKLDEEKRKLALSKSKIKVDEAKKPLTKNSKEPIRTMSKPSIKDIKPRQFPPPDVRTFKRPEMKKKNKRRIDSDEEYDSEMDDFIVDEEEDNGEDYSKYISQIFNYDKHKYSQYDDADDAAMESNFAQQLKEEFRSTKFGIMEDLEDIRREKIMEAKRRKMMANKKLKK